MTMRGHIKNGAVVLDEPVKLPDGMDVEVEVRPLVEESEADTDTEPTWGEVFRDLAGSVQGLPSDLAENHDHYIHGTAKGLDQR